MKSYKYLTVDEPHLTVECTDEKVLEWVVSMVKEVMPSCEYHNNWPIGKIRTNFKIYSVHVTKLEERDTEVRWWIMEQLGQQGWEPFALSGLYCVHFRLETEIEGQTH